MYKDKSQMHISNKETCRQYELFHIRKYGRKVTDHNWSTAQVQNAAKLLTQIHTVKVYKPEPVLKENLYLWEYFSGPKN
jgi:hypothetical protein